MRIVGAIAVRIGSVAVSKLYVGASVVFQRATRSWWAQDNGDFVYSWND